MNRTTKGSLADQSMIRTRLPFQYTLFLDAYLTAYHRDKSSTGKIIEPLDIFLKLRDGNIIIRSMH